MIVICGKIDREIMHQSIPAVPNSFAMDEQIIIN